MRGKPSPQALLQLMRADKPIGTLLLLWPTLWALWIAAGGLPEFRYLLIFILGTFLMRSAGCVINDLADRHWDGGVERTRGRPLVTGAVSVGQAKALFLLLLAAAFGLVLLTNALTVQLSFVAAALASIYPFTKRFTHFPQVALGAAFSCGIPMAFSAQTGALPAELWLLYFGNLLWTVAYDTKYAMVDRDDDLVVGIKSTAVYFGQRDRWAVALLQGGFLLLMFVAGRAFAMGPAYYLGLLGAAALCGYHQYLIRGRDRDACFRAFLHNNWVGAAIFAGIVIDFALRGSA